MPLVGGGGAGNVAGGNPSGTGSTLQYIGEHAYANSGAVDITNANETMLDFTTASSSYVVAKLQIGSEAGSGDDMLFSVLFNGEIIMNEFVSGTYHEYPDFGAPLRIVIAPETRVTIKGNNQTGATIRKCYAVITGRVYA